MTKINISIPQPCHENWEGMTLEDKGRFCTSCQKKVFDFTKASDREIVNAFQQNLNLCGRFLDTQLNRDLIKPEKKSPIWLATTSTIISFLGLGSHQAVAQEEPVKIVQTDREIVGKPAPNIKQGEIATTQEIEVKGIVSDKNGPLPGANVTIKGSNISTQTDLDGKYNINVKKGDILSFSFIGFKEINIAVDENSKNLNIQMNEELIYLGGPIYYKKRTFFGRIFHSIGNIFK